MATDPLQPGDPADPATISMRGVGLAVPLGWEGRISLSAPTAEGSETFPVVHACTAPLPARRGDYGSNVVERLGPYDVFISLIEMGPSAAGRALYPAEEEPFKPLTPEEFHPRQLQRTLPGQCGTQRFFTYRGRAFCLYVVLGSFVLRADLIETANRLLARMNIDGAT